MPSAPQGLRVRRSLQELQVDYEAGDKESLEALWRAWKGIKERPAEDNDSFFTLGGYHGAPFRGAGWANADYWGGYCNHGNILFPTWHRVYLLKLEEALRRVPSCDQVTLPYWDETSDDSLTGGIPWALTREKVELDGQTIDNPLRSFVLPQTIRDSIGGDDVDNSKNKDYETVRYPLAGRVGTEADQAATAAHNALFTPEKRLELLNTNVSNWLRASVQIAGRDVPGGKVAEAYQSCLDAPNYTVFSNVTSANQWNNEHIDQQNHVIVVPLERPHNAMHLAVGGFEVSGVPTSGVAPITGSSGDMSTTETAGLDPIFYFHHCFVDRVFWLWQKKNDATDELDIIPHYPGTNSVDWQGPTPGTVPNTWLTLESPLDPFTKVGGDPYTSLDCINIETQLGFTYSSGSLEKMDEASQQLAAAAAAAPAQVVAVHGINRAPIRGSFLVSVFGNVGGQRIRLGTEAVFSRWNVQGCANCQTHLEVKAFVPVPSAGTGMMAAASAATLRQAETYEVEIRTYDGVLGQAVTAPGRMAAAGRVTTPVAPSFRLEVR